MERWVGKEGVPNPWSVPSEESYAGSQRGNIEGGPTADLSALLSDKRPRSAAGTLTVYNRLALLPARPAKGDSRWQLAISTAPPAFSRLTR